jgi:non-heme chloroperoxidase
MNMITTKDGTTIYFKDWGNGRPVVFSQGWPLSADAWDAQMLFLGENGYRAIAHDPARPRSHEPTVERQRDGHLRSRHVLAPGMQAPRGAPG